MNSANLAMIIENRVRLGVLSRVKARRYRNIAGAKELLPLFCFLFALAIGGKLCLDEVSLFAGQFNWN